MKSNVVIGDEAVDRMIAGIKVATEAIRLSYGACGCNAAVENDFYPYVEVANDAQTLIQASFVEDLVGKIGLGFLKELSDKANKDSGDGRKTTCILAEELMVRGRALKLSPLELKRELDKFIPIIEAKIDEQKRPISEEDVHKVATISSESEELGQLIGNIYQEIGKDGVIHIEPSGTFTNSYKTTEGVKFNGAGYLSPHMVHDEDAIKDKVVQSRAVYEKPTILVTKRKINHVNDINPLLEEMQKRSLKDLIIFADDMDSNVASMLVKAHRDGIFNICIVKAPVLWKNWAFEDFARVTGATVVEDATGVTFTNLSFEHLGTCGKIVVDKEDTVITGGADISDHIKELEAMGDNDSKLRLQWLKTKTAILKLGANNESELSYKRLKCQDAINASKLALEDGIVAGGGACLHDIGCSIGECADSPIEDLIALSLTEPLRQILKNSNVSIEETAHEILSEKKDPADRFRGVNTRGFNAKSGKVVDMFDANIVDAAKVVKNAVRNAIALASTVLTARIVVTIPPKSAEQIAAQALQNNRYRF